tara:strand:- start:261 stop:611 length:351 start_codon:yes stop_codon:yes gene_type:complete
MKEETLQSKSSTKEEKDKIIAKSVSQRLVFIGMLSAFRELIPCYMEDAVFTDKHILNSGKKALNQMFRQFDEQTVGDNPYHDSIVDKFIAMAEDIREQTETFLIKRDDVSEVQQED